jgi:hypothetical protein
LKGLQKINLTDDSRPQECLAAGGLGVYVFFNDYISLLVGPVFFV